MHKEIKPLELASNGLRSSQHNLFYQIESRTARTNKIVQSLNIHPTSGSGIATGKFGQALNSVVAEILATKANSSRGNIKFICHPSLREPTPTCSHNGANERLNVNRLLANRPTNLLLTSHYNALLLE
jgi:hypothetical protein